MADLKVKRIVKRTENVTIEFGAHELLAALRLAYPEIPNADVQLTVHVPGGGDYSNENLEISKGCPLTVSWTFHSEGFS